MKSKISFLLLSAYILNVCGLKLPGPLVYVVTPSPRPRTDGSMSRSAPFYYHNWIKRMDSPVNDTTTTTTTQRAKTQDLIFAEFESDNGNQMKKIIRKLLEKERIEQKAPTTVKPYHESSNSGSEMWTPSGEKNSDKKPDVDMTDYFALYNNFYNNGELAPVYLPSTTVSTTKLSTLPTTTTTSAPTTTPDPVKVENIWHIIDNEKYGHYSGNWEEVPVESNKKNGAGDSNNHKVDPNTKDNSDLDENFALPGFGTNPGNGAENESRAIRTESNAQFPYVNLKPFLMKPGKNQQNLLYNNKKGNTMFNLNDFKEVKQPVRGEAQDFMQTQEPIDRYNPAQPYLPAPQYGSKSKQSSPISQPAKTVANLVPPPLPPIPKVTGDDFPSPGIYDSFPPYAPSGPDQDSSPLPPPPQSKPISMYQPPQPPTTDDSDSDTPQNNGPPLDLGYRYNKPPPQIFLPTIPPAPAAPSKPFKGYSYDKPPMVANTPPAMNSGFEEVSEFQGYHYNKPAISPALDHDPTQSSPESYGPQDHHSFGQDSDYPESGFDKPPSGKGGKGNSMKDEDMGMAPPPPDMKPQMDDSGFPADFPGDFKYHHDFGHDHYEEYHHHHPTTTTEMPRVNRFSYYYLGKKLYYLPLYFSVYFIVYVGALIIKAVLRHKIVYPNSWRPNDQTASFFSKRSVDSWEMSDEKMHDITGKVTRAIAGAAEKYMAQKAEKSD